MVLEEVAAVPSSAGTTKLKKEWTPNQEDESRQSPLVRSYQAPVPYPHKLTRSKLKPLMVRFLDLLKKVNINVPFFEILKEVPSYLNFGRGLLSEKGKPDNIPVVVIGKVCSAPL